MLGPGFQAGATPDLCGTFRGSCLPSSISGGLHGAVCLPLEEQGVCSLLPNASQVLEVTVLPLFARLLPGPLTPPGDIGRKGSFPFGHGASVVNLPLAGR